MGPDSGLFLEADSSAAYSVPAQQHSLSTLEPPNPHQAPHEPGTAPKRTHRISGNSPHSGNRNILLAGGDHDQRALLRAYLQHVGFHVIGCADLEAAFRVLDEGCAVELLLVDSELLAVSSSSLRDSFAEQYPNLPIFVISGRRMTDGTLREIKHRLWEPDSQPFLLPDLLGRIQASLENDSLSDSVGSVPEDSDKIVSISSASPPHPGKPFNRHRKRVS